MKWKRFLIIQFVPKVVLSQPIQNLLILSLSINVPLIIINSFQNYKWINIYLFWFYLGSINSWLALSVFPCPIKSIMYFYCNAKLIFWMLIAYFENVNVHLQNVIFTAIAIKTQNITFIEFGFIVFRKHQFHKHFKLMDDIFIWYFYCI